jgi:hypothetical protein
VLKGNRFGWIVYSCLFLVCRIRGIDCIDTTENGVFAVVVKKHGDVIKDILPWLNRGICQQSRRWKQSKLVWGPTSCRSTANPVDNEDVDCLLSSHSKDSWERLLSSGKGILPIKRGDVEDI